jgi:hypothetical protein
LAYYVLALVSRLGKPRGGRCIDKRKNLPEPKIVNDRRCHFGWRVIYIVCAAFTIAYVFFDVLDLDGSNWRVTQYTPKGVVLVADTFPESDVSSAPEHPLARALISNDFTKSSLTPALFRWVERSAMVRFPLSGRRRYRVALPRSSVSDPSSF